ncbi:dihydrofolate reductase [Sinorhizobium sp. M4_45]|nr:dihydrofolate reductase [Sinorhizobium sp. M4_45]
MGRGTYDFLAKEQSPWAYGNQRVIVVTSQPLDDPKGTLEVCSDVDALISELRALDDGDVLLLGGGQLQMAFMERGALDEIEVYLIPEILGSGQPLFPLTGFQASPTLISAATIGKGCVRLHYRM